MMVNDILREMNLLTSVLETMSDGLMVIDKEGIIISFNPAAEQMTGYSSEEVIGKNCTILDTDTCVYKTQSGKEKKCSLFQDGKFSGRGCRIRSKDGKVVHLLKNAAVLKDKKGEIIGGVETMTDITSLVMKDLQIDELKKDIQKETGFMGILGTSVSMKRVFEQIANASKSEAPVIITGESGTGKELVASAIHSLSKRKNGPFVKVNCAALNESLLESELFGHRKGAFTGAVHNRKGRFEAANSGTIFLDEIGDMPLSMQVKLLRVVEGKEIERVGDNESIPVDIRLITATNKDLHTLVNTGAFREDLLYRVHVIPLHLPPLRERIEDLPLLASFFLRRLSSLNGKEIRGISQQAMEALTAYSWPGNIRQLINSIEYSVITCRGEIIELSHLPDYLLYDGSFETVQTKKQVSRKDVIGALSKFQGNRTLAAKHLGISRVTLWKRLKNMEDKGKDFFE